MVEGHPKAFLVRAPTPGLRNTRGRRAAGERIYVKEDIKEGEILNYGGIFTESVTRTRPACCFNWILGKRTSDFTEEVQYLKCTDLDGREALVELNQEGVFSPVGDPGTEKEDCVYQLDDLVHHVDLPVHVKLAWGHPPTTPCSFTGLLRLEDIYYEETIIACTLGGKRSMMVEFPTDSDIQFFVALDAHRYFEHPVIQEALCHCDMNLDAYLNTIKVVQSFYPDHIKLGSGSESKRRKPIPERSLPPTPLQHLDESTVGSQATTDEFTDDSDFSDEEDEPHQSHQVQKRAPTAAITAISQGPFESNEYEEIPGVGRHVQVISLPPPGEEDNYLQPAPGHMHSKSNTEQRISNEPEVILQSSLKTQNTNSTGRMSGRRVAFAPITNTEEEAGPPQDSQVNARPLSYKTGNQQFQKQLRDRLDAFLSDSIHEMHKVKPNECNSHVGGDAPVSIGSTEGPEPQKVPPQVPHKKRIVDPQHALQSHEDMNAFLETIFDPDNMSQDGLERDDAFSRTPNRSFREPQGNVMPDRDPSPTYYSQTLRTLPHSDHPPPPPVRATAGHTLPSRASDRISSAKPQPGNTHPIHSRPVNTQPTQVTSPTSAQPAYGRQTNTLPPHRKSPPPAQPAHGRPADIQLHQQTSFTHAQPAHGRSANVQSHQHTSPPPAQPAHGRPANIQLHQQPSVTHAQPAHGRPINAPTHQQTLAAHVQRPQEQAANVRTLQRTSVSHAEASHTLGVHLSPSHVPPPAIHTPGVHIASATSPPISGRPVSVHTSPAHIPLPIVHTQTVHNVSAHALQPVHTSTARPPPPPVHAQVVHTWTARPPPPPVHARVVHTWTARPPPPLVHAQVVHTATPRPPPPPVQTQVHTSTARPPPPPVHAQVVHTWTARPPPPPVHAQVVHTATARPPPPPVHTQVHTSTARPPPPPVHTQVHTSTARPPPQPFDAQVHTSTARPPPPPVHAQVYTSTARPPPQPVHAQVVHTATARPPPPPVHTQVHTPTARPPPPPVHAQVVHTSTGCPPPPPLHTQAVHMSADVTHLNAQRPTFVNSSTNIANSSVVLDSNSLNISTASRPPSKFSYSTTDATLRRHNMKNLQLVKPTPQSVNFIDDSNVALQRSQNDQPSEFVSRPDHLPIQTLTDALRNLKPTNNNNKLASIGDNTFIPIEPPESFSPVRQSSHSRYSGEYPRDRISSPDRDFSDRVTNRTDSGIFVSPGLSDFHFDCESPYQAPSEESSWSPPENLAPLSVTDVAHCLRYIGMKDPAVFRFVQEQVDGKLMLELDDMLLREGFPELNALERKKVLDFVGGWRPKKL